MALKALFYPDVKFDSLAIPYIYKEIYFDGLYVDVLNGKSELTIIDVGANIGVVTQYMRDYAKKLYAIEPSSEHFEALKKNKEFNQWDNVEVFNLAISDQDGEAELGKNPANRTMNTIVVNHPGDDGRYLVKGGKYSMSTFAPYSEWEKVKTMRMDTFFKENNIEKCDFMKLDVEGAEEMILRSEGFKNVLDKINQIEIEFHFPDWQELVKLMIGYGYQARRYDCSAIVILFIK